MFIVLKIIKVYVVTVKQKHRHLKQRCIELLSATDLYIVFVFGIVLVEISNSNLIKTQNFFDDDLKPK